jgi:hypothetical protein
MGDMASPLVRLRDAYLDPSAPEHDPTVRRLFAAYFDDADTAPSSTVRSRATRLAGKVKRRLRR